MCQCCLIFVFLNCHTNPVYLYIQINISLTKPKSLVVMPYIINGSMIKCGS